MTKDGMHSSRAKILRQRAEDKVRGEEITAGESMLAEAESRHALHELRVHQVELEMQNDKLRRAQEELESSRAKYSSLYDLALEAAGMGAWSYHLDTGEVFWDQRCRSQWGLLKEDKIDYARAIAAIHPDDRAATDTAVKSALAGADGGAYQREFRVLWPDGSVHWIASHGLVYFEDEGEQRRAVRFIGANRDITERKLLEDAQTFLLHCGYPGFGEDFFHSLARYLAHSLGMDYVCIDSLEGDGLAARTVAVYNNGTFEDNIVYTLKDTPCGDVVGKTVCCFPKEVRQLFPRDEALQVLKAESYVGTTLWSFEGKPIGLIAVIGRRPLTKTTLAESMLKMVAVRAAGELDRQRVEDALRRKSLDLNKRIQELNCLFSFSKLIEQPGLSIPKLCEGLVQLIPAGWQYPEITAARLFFGDQIFQTANFSVTLHKQSADILVNQKNVGRLQVCYLEDRPELDEGPFLKEERYLVNELASRLGKTLQRIYAETERENLVKRLEHLVEIQTADLVAANKELSEEIKERRRAGDSLKESEKQLRRLSGQLLTIQESERSRISRELHDQLGQDLTLTKLLLRMLGKKVKANPEEAGEDCGKLISLADQMIENVRRLSRDLSPSILEDLGLTVALQWLLSTFQKNDSIQIHSRLAEVDSLVPKEGHIMIYRVFQESLNNIVKHSAAKQVWVTADVDDDRLTFVVADDGKGFEMNSTEAPSHSEPGLGLRILHERARILGGTLEIWSQPNAGTRVTLCVPAQKKS